MCVCVCEREREREREREACEQREVKFGTVDDDDDDDDDDDRQDEKSRPLFLGNNSHEIQHAMRGIDLRHELSRTRRHQNHGDARPQEEIQEPLR